VIALGCGVDDAILASKYQCGAFASAAAAGDFAIRRTHHNLMRPSSAESHLYATLIIVIARDAVLFMQALSGAYLQATHFGYVTAILGP